MNEQITIFYNKNKKQPNDYLVKRVITQDGMLHNRFIFYDKWKTKELS